MFGYGKFSLMLQRRLMGIDGSASHGNSKVSLSAEEIVLLRNLVDEICDRGFSSPEKKRMFWQDVRILQYEYFPEGIPQEMKKMIEEFCLDETSYVSQKGL